MFKNYAHIILFSFILIFLIGCSTKGQYKKNYFPINYHNYRDKDKKPEPNKIYETEVGSSLLHFTQAFFIPQIQTKNDISSVKESTENYKYKITLPSSKLILAGTNNTGQFYLSNKNITLEWIYKNSKDYKEKRKGGIYISKNPSESKSIFWLRRYWSENAEKFYYKKSKKQKVSTCRISSDIEFTHLKLTAFPLKLLPDEYKNNYEMFKRQIIYSGKSGSNIKFIYREFKDNLIRAAFSEDLTYDLSESRIIGYQGARIKIIKATNTKLRYKILKHIPFRPRKQIHKEVSD